ncbi:MAG TPA: hypothetical protein VK446_11415 [Methylocystis sp.]|nr:hypothetical protein [Methylocystis sp.]
MRLNRKLGLALVSALVVFCEQSGPARAQYGYPDYPYPAVAPAPPVVAVYPYIWGGRRYCWYGDAWNGAGWYWCGFAWRRGLGWGGGYGWNGWAWRGGRGYYHGGYRGGYYRGHRHY